MKTNWMIFLPAFPKTCSKPGIIAIKKKITKKTNMIKAKYLKTIEITPIKIKATPTTIALIKEARAVKTFTPIVLQES